jgi:23S rRNA pseudouridine955/2504/2580 synthase
MNNFNVTIGKDDHDRRLDRILRKAFKDFPLSFIHRLIRKKQILINDVPAKMDSRVQEGDVLSIKGSVTLPEKTDSSFQRENLKSTTPRKQAIAHLPKLDILYENSDLLILNKAAGLDVHGSESLETLVQAYLKDMLSPSLSFRPGPLHRLDKPTSGIIAFSKSLEGARRFSEALQTGTIKKYYLALMDGIIEEKEVWEDMLYRDKNLQKTFQSEQDGQQAVMTIRPLMASAQYTLAFIELETGRTHQIRAQGSIHHHPLAGDKKYGGSFLKDGFFLHAAMLSLPAEIAPDLPSLMTAPIPPERKALLQSIFGNKMHDLVDNISVP